MIDVSPWTLKIEIAVFHAVIETVMKSTHFLTLRNPLILEECVSVRYLSLRFTHAGYALILESSVGGGQAYIVGMETSSLARGYVFGRSSIDNGAR